MFGELEIYWLPEIIQVIVCTIKLERLLSMKILVLILFLPIIISQFLISDASNIGASDLPVTSTSATNKQAGGPIQKINQAAPRAPSSNVPTAAPTSNVSVANPESGVPATPEKGMNYIGHLNICCC